MKTNRTIYENQIRIILNNPYFKNFFNDFHNIFIKKINNIVEKNKKLKDNGEFIEYKNNCNKLVGMNKVMSDLIKYLQRG